MGTFSRTDNSIISTWWWTVDRWLLMSIALLITIGIVLVFGASPAVAERIGLPSFHFVERQLVFLGLSILVMFSVSLLSPVMVRRSSDVSIFSVFRYMFGVSPMFWRNSL